MATKQRFEYISKAREMMQEVIDLKDDVESKTQFYIDSAGGRLFKVCSKQGSYYVVLWVGDGEYANVPIYDMYSMARQERIIEVDLAELEDDIVDMMLNKTEDN